MKNLSPVANPELFLVHNIGILSHGIGTPQLGDAVLLGKESWSNIPWPCWDNPQVCTCSFVGVPAFQEMKSASIQGNDSPHSANTSLQYS